MKKTLLLMFLAFSCNAQNDHETITNPEFQQKLIDDYLNGEYYQFERDMNDNNSFGEWDEIDPYSLDNQADPYGNYFRNESIRPSVKNCSEYEMSDESLNIEGSILQLDIYYQSANGNGKVSLSVPTNVTIEYVIDAFHKGASHVSRGVPFSYGAPPHRITTMMANDYLINGTFVHDPKFRLFSFIDPSQSKINLTVINQNRNKVD